MNTEKKIVRILKKNKQGLSISELAKKLKIHRHTVSRYIMELKGSGVVSVRKVGPTKLCYLGCDDK